MPCPEVLEGAMKLRSRAGGKPVKARRSKAVTLKRANEPKGVRRRGSSSTADQETTVARLTRELDKLLQRQTATSFMEITQRRRAEERFRLAVEAAPSGMIMADSEGRIILINAYTEKLFGYGRDELTGQKLEMLVPERFRGKHSGLRAGYITQPTIRPMGVGQDLFALRKDGGEFPVEIGLSPIATDQGTMVLAAIVDITERKQSEEAQKLRLILETALDAVVVMTSDGIVADWNDRAVSIFGWLRDEAVGRTMADLIIPERYREAHKNGLQRYLRTRQGDALGRRIELSGIKKNGEEFPVELSISAIQDGERILFVGCLRDMTEHHALRLARTEVARVTQRMAMGEMTASIVHEIKQPLAAIALNANAGLRWLTRTAPNLDEIRDALNRVVTDTNRTNEVIDGIRSVFKKENQTKARQDVNKLIREVLTLVGSDTEAQHIAVRTQLSDGLREVPANLVQLRQVMVNLITNAIDAMSTVVDRPRVLRLKTEAHEPSYLLITVEDSGIGIDPESMNRIFDPFFTTKSHGMGMGLSICRSIVENHGGRLSVSLGPSHGSIFHVFLPTDLPRRN
ncbi:MAG: PAS domain S-box protein [Pseudolabrys sp.]